jgi:hypothetical protein
VCEERERREREREKGGPCLEKEKLKKTTPDLLPF